MKRLKTLSYNERKIVSSWGIKGDYWKKERVSNGYITICNELTNEIREVPAYKKGEKQ